MELGCLAIRTARFMALLVNPIAPPTEAAKVPRCGLDLNFLLRTFYKEGDRGYV